MHIFGWSTMIITEAAVGVKIWMEFSSFFTSPCPTIQHTDRNMLLMIVVAVVCVAFAMFGGYKNLDLKLICTNSIQFAFAGMERDGI